MGPFTNRRDGLSITRLAPNKQTCFHNYKSEFTRNNVTLDAKHHSHSRNNWNFCQRANRLAMLCVWRCVFCSRANPVREVVHCCWGLYVATGCFSAIHSLGLKTEGFPNRRLPLYVFFHVHVLKDCKVIELGVALLQIRATSIDACLLDEFAIFDGVGDDTSRHRTDSLVDFNKRSFVLINFYSSILQSVQKALAVGHTKNLTGAARQALLCLDVFSSY